MPLNVTQPRNVSTRHCRSIDARRLTEAAFEGGQRLFVLPNLKLVVAVTAGNYGADDQWMPPTRVLREVVLASIQ